MGPLHCIPAIVKDNFETIGLQSAAGSLSLQGSSRRAMRFRSGASRTRARSSWPSRTWRSSRSPVRDVSSILPGYTKNPYALDRVTAGSSGGTAAAVAANFGAIGLGSDTGNSIRGPASHQALVGIRSTMGLTSRAGVAPLNLLADIAGPMTRTVADAVAVLQSDCGTGSRRSGDGRRYAHSPAASARTDAGALPNYSAALMPDGLKGRRIGVLRQAYERDTTDPEIVKVFMAAVDDLKRAGAMVSTPCGSTRAGRRQPGGGACGGFKFDINRWLAEQATAASEDTRGDRSLRQFHPTVQRRLEHRGKEQRTPRDAGVPGGGDYREQCAPP